MGESNRHLNCVAFQISSPKRGRLKLSSANCNTVVPFRAWQLETWRPGDLDPHPMSASHAPCVIPCALHDIFEVGLDPNPPCSNLSPAGPRPFPCIQPSFIRIRQPFCRANIGSRGFHKLDKTFGLNIAPTKSL